MTREADDTDRAFEEGQNSMMRSLREARRERDEALALLSKAREAWAELLEARQSHATEREAGEAAARDWIAWKHASESYRAGFSVRLEATGARVQAAWADLAKILGTGE